MTDSPFNAVETHLMKNGVIMARTYSNVTNSLGNSGNMAVTQLDKGDRVWVRLGYVDDLYGIDEEYTSFSGFLLY
ncbi:hypothetical protein FSP39_001836 [Pinctada imbricata]|uniref:C1q domain-containing protein n=1 Tax=Pinctada imbricata TaxID=66713 RepID=A0AA88YAS8_PINIB|nr:hypothetical protein FSP39_001836 [Pinctada imbricata]